MFTLAGPAARAMLKDDRNNTAWSPQADTQTNPQKTAEGRSRDCGGARGQRAGAGRSSQCGRGGRVGGVGLGNT